MVIDRDLNIVYGPPATEHFSDVANSFAEFVYTRLTRRGDYPVLTDGISGKQLTAIELRNAAIRVADCLRSLGITDQDKVAFCSENRLEMAISLVGAIFLGATVVPMNFAYSDRELIHTLELAQPKLIFASSQSVDNIRKVTKHSRTVKNIVLFDEVPTKGVITFSSFIGNRSVKTNLDAVKFLPQEFCEKVALILYSSGTTGLPKGVQLTEKNIMLCISNHELRQDAELDKYVKEKIVLTVGPWSHAFGFMGMFGLVLSKERVIFMPKFVDRDYLRVIQDYKVNITHAVPPLLVFLAKSPIVDEYDLSSLKFIGVGAAPLSKELDQAVRDRIGIPIIRQGYGMTEATLGLSEQSDKFNKEGSIGELCAGTMGRVVDVETGKNLGPNKRGELQFKSGTIMKGYIGDAVATQTTVDADGWLHTGDIGIYDEDGEWFIVDRLKELIKYNGFQVPPAEIEGLLLQHPLISDAAVIGVPDERYGELPMAFVVRQEAGGALTEQEVIQFVAERASRPKQLHGGVRFLQSIPKNPSGKMLRRELRDLLSNVRSKL